MKICFKRCDNITFAIVGQRVYHLQEAFELDIPRKVDERDGALFVTFDKELRFAATPVIRQTDKYTAVQVGTTYIIDDQQRIFKTDKPLTDEWKINIDTLQCERLEIAKLTPALIVESEQHDIKSGLEQKTVRSVKPIDKTVTHMWFDVRDWSTTSPLIWLVKFDGKSFGASVEIKRSKGWTPGAEQRIVSIKRVGRRLIMIKLASGQSVAAEQISPTSILKVPELSSVILENEVLHVNRMPTNGIADRDEHTLVYTDGHTSSYNVIKVMHSDTYHVQDIDMSYVNEDNTKVSAV